MLERIIARVFIALLTSWISSDESNPVTDALVASESIADLKDVAKSPAVEDLIVNIFKKALIK